MKIIQHGSCYKKNQRQKDKHAIETQTPDRQTDGRRPEQSPPSQTGSLRQQEDDCQTEKDKHTDNVSHRNTDGQT